MKTPRVLGFDWKESPESVVDQIRRAIKGIDRPILNRVVTQNDQVVVIISDKKLTKKEQHELLWGDEK